MADQNPFHGVEVDDIPNQLVLISQVNSGTIALLGTAPGVDPGIYRVSSPDDATAFGPSVFDGRTIPHALDAILAQGVSSVIVINCAKDTHLADVVAEATEVGANYKVVLAHNPVGPVVVKTTGGSPVTLVAGTDYDYNEGDAFITILTRRTYAVGTDLHVDYSWFNKTLVVNNDIIGGIDGTTGLRTGIALLDLAYSKYGITPKILIAPVYVEQETICNALDLQATALRARVIVDAPKTLTVAGAIESRGPGGTYVNFDTVNPRRVLCFPYVYKPDPLQPDADGVAFPLSPYLAGLWSASIANNGIQQSPSNLPVSGFTKLVTDISCGLGVRGTDTDILNAAGINTVFTGFGAGVRPWGNRNATYPESKDGPSFLSVFLTRDIMDESMIMASIAFQDKPLNSAWVTMAVSALNGFINSLILSGALIGGSAYYDPAKNPAAGLQAGKVVLSSRHLAPSAAEWIVIENEIDTTLYNSIG